ncbi:MAG: AAA family ATPase [Candidatus Midichloriaceae bacterium]
MDHNLKIAQVSDGQYMQYQGKYPVIFISLKDIKGNSVEEITEQLKDLIKELYKNFRYLKESSELYGDEKNDFQKYFSMDYDGISLENSIKFLCGLLYKHHKEAVYVLVDEYDTPVSGLLERHLGEELNLQLPVDVSKLISQMVCSSISKTNPYVEKLILTGVFDTTYKGTTAGCNNIRSYGISDKRFSESFGFTTEEVKILIDKFEGKAPFDDREKVFNIIKNWYGGYFVPTVTIDSSINYLESNSKIHTEVFTPWAVMNFLYDSFRDKELSPQSYWSKTGYKTILERLFTQEKCKNSSLSKKFLEISKNITYELNFDNQISLFKYDWNSDIDNEAFFSHLLLNSGYLAGKEAEGIFKFSIPNKELLKEFTDLLKSTKDSKDCGIILENLQKNRQVEILEMIRKNDSSEDFMYMFEKKFTTYKIKCDDSSMNFNFMSLAMIYSNEEVYNNLKRLCDNESHHTLDNANDFKALDYSSVLQRNFLVNDANNFTFYHDIVCSVQTNYWGGILLYIFPTWGTMMTISSISTLFKDNRIAGFLDQHTTIDKCAKPLLVLMTLGAVKILNDYFSTKGYCQEYIDYQKINITKPNEFTTLKHIDKYARHYNDVYIVVNSACSKEKDTITEIIQPIFKKPYLIDKNIKFTLCKITASKQEKSQDNVFITEYPQCVNTDYPQEKLPDTLVVMQEELAHDKTAQPDEL